MRQCSKCGGEYPDSFFHIRRGKSRYTMCIGCVLTERTNAKGMNRYMQKASDAIKHHAERHKIPRRELILKYGWITHQMAHDEEHAMLNGCPYCFRPFSEMAHGLADLSIDIIDPTKPPYYSTNTKWVCITCNSEKQKTPPAIWEEKKRAWALWNERQAEIKHNQLYGLPMFNFNSDRGAFA